jgi:hypothetical protein
MAQQVTRKRKIRSSAPRALIALSIRLRHNAPANSTGTNRRFHAAGLRQRASGRVSARKDVIADINYSLIP